MPPLATNLALSVLATDPPAVLARSGDDFEWSKLVPFVLFVALWLFGALSTVLAKAKKRAGPSVLAPPPARATSTGTNFATTVTPPPLAKQGFPRLPAVVPPVPTYRVQPPSVPTPTAVPPVLTAKRPKAKKAKSVRPAAAQATPAVPAPLIGARPAGAAQIRRQLAAGVGRSQLGLVDLFDPPPSLRG